MGNTKRSVPPEMLDKIFDFLRGSGVAWCQGDASPDNSALVPAALVCPQWRDVAHRLFWQDARITFDHDKRPPRVPDMKHPINHLWIEYLGDGNPRTLEEFMGWGYDSDSDSEAERVIGNDVATDWTMALLEMNPLLKTLCITTEMGISGPNWVFLRTPTLAGLKRLDLEFGNTVYEPRDVTSPFPFHLTHLGLTLYPRPVSSNLLRELFAASRNTLKSLRLTINCEQEWNEPALLHEGITLVSSIVETLVLEFRELWHKSDQSALVAVAAYPNIGAFTNLKHLSLIKFDEDTSIIPITHCLHNLPLPATLTQLTISIGVFKPASAKQITDILAIPALSNLERINLVELGQETLKADTAGVEVMGECDRRGIKLLFRQDLL